MFTFASAANGSDGPPRKRRRFLRWIVRLFVVVVGAPALYVAAALGLGYLGTGDAYVPAEDGVEIQVLTNGVHLSLMLPIRAADVNWGDFLDGPRGARWTASTSYIEIGWGDRDFYMKVPTWEDLTLGVAAKAILLPSATAMRIVYHYGPAEGWGEPRTLRLAPGAFRRLVRFVEEGFRRDAGGKLMPILGFGYPEQNGRDEFYEGTGSYHLFYTCNTWVVGALKSAGVPAPIWTPFDFPAYWHLPE